MNEVTESYHSGGHECETSHDEETSPEEDPNDGTNGTSRHEGDKSKLLEIFEPRGPIMIIILRRAVLDDYKLVNSVVALYLTHLLVGKLDDRTRIL